MKREGQVQAEPEWIHDCPRHGAEWLWWGLTCLACEVEADPERAAELPWVKP